MLSSYGARLAGPCRVQCYAAADAFHLVSIAVLYIEQNRRRQSRLPYFRSGIRASLCVPRMQRAHTERGHDAWCRRN